MCSNLASKILFFIFFIFIFSCQDSLSTFQNKNKTDFVENTFVIEKNERIDLSFYTMSNDNIIDFYTRDEIFFNFFKDDIKYTKIDSFEDKLVNNLSVNIFYKNDNLYSINSRGEILKFNPENYKLIDKIKIGPINNNSIPVSFSLIDNDFIVGYKSGQIVRVNTKGEVIWNYQNNNNILNTPIKHFDNYLIVLYPKDIVFLSSESGLEIFKKKYQSNNVIQSTGGKIVDYFNLIYFILPSSEFHSVDTFLFEDHISKLNDIKINTSLNNLNDKIHIYKNLIVYLDNGNKINTFDIINDDFLLTNFRVENLNSSILFNNAFIVKNQKNIEFYNIANGYLFSQFNSEKILKKESKIIYAIVVNNKLHLFFDKGNILIFDHNLNLEKHVDLKIKTINMIYNYQDKLFISTFDGKTYIF